MTSYAIVDLETIGFSPAHHHRVIEIAIVHTDESGVVTDEWETLVDPQRRAQSGKLLRLHHCPLDSAHVALADARAVARLLAHYIETDRDFTGSWCDVIDCAEYNVWPSLPPGAVRPVTRQQRAASQRDHFLARLTARAPRSEVPEANSYLALLDRALLDRQLSRHEQDELVVAIAGWRSGDAAEFLKLSAEEAAYVELKLALADYLRDLRTRNGWTQAQVARRLGLSQSRVAKMEAVDATVSLDLLVRSLLGLGVSRSKVGNIIARAAYVAGVEFRTESVSSCLPNKRVSHDRPSMNCWACRLRVERLARQGGSP